ncbi:MAG: ATP-binding protein, partial [Verrucomicrobiales bacterium]
LELSRHGLFAALAELARQTAKLSGTECKLIQSGELPERGGSYEIHTYRIVQECISNAIRHGKASLITIEATAKGPFLAVTVTDNGVGFEFPVGKPGMGLHLMEYRARLIGGGLEVEKPFEGGCRVTCRVMVEEKEPHPTGIDAFASASDGNGGPDSW